MVDMFAAAANRTYQKQREEAAQQPLFTMEDNALARVIEDQKKVRAEEAAAAARRRAEAERDRLEKEAAAIAEFEFFLESTKYMFAAVGRAVESFYVNPGGEVVTVHRPSEAITVKGLNLSNRQMRLISLRRVIEAVLG